MLTPDDFDVVGSAANGAAALPEMNRADPDIVVLDYNTPGLDGLLTARLIKEERPDHASRCSSTRPGGSASCTFR